uniref:Uncharacterized protein n=1 Tax=Triticum urartu TaxID=4572 RepID=A0A8R7UBV0_TRIUA
MHSAVVRRPQKVGHRHLQLVHASPASRNLLLPGTAGAGARMPRRFRREVGQRIPCSTGWCKILVGDRLCMDIRTCML